MATKNPTKKVLIDDVKYVSIEPNKYTGTVIYGELGESVGTLGLTNKINHRVEYDASATEHPYSYNFEGDSADSDTNPYIMFSSSGFGSDSKRSIAIGSVKDGIASLNGDVNRDTVGVNSGNEFKYNAGNMAIESGYNDTDVYTGGINSTYQDNEGNWWRVDEVDDKGNITSKTKIEGEADTYNTSNTMSKTMNYYKVTVKPMDVREL